MGADCPDCSTRLPADGRRCRACGWVAESTAPAPATVFCKLDGGELDALGLCAAGDGFPSTSACPFQCPICRAPLGWDGGCYRCNGSRTPHDRASWMMPGNLYELDDTGHYRLMAKGPRPVAAAAVAAAAVAEVERRLKASTLARALPIEGKVSAVSALAAIADDSGHTPGERRRP